MAVTYLVANWKANKTAVEARHWLDEVAKAWPQVEERINVILCVPLIHLSVVAESGLKVKLGAQNVSPYPDGTYTGEVSARMLEGLVEYVLVGHSERRHYFGETSTVVALKVREALEHTLTPIIGVSRETWREQLNQFSPTELSKSVLMYEPPEAISRQVGPIGEGDAAPVGEVVAAIKEIKSVASHTPVLYGGSVKAHNVADFLKEPTISGVVPGSASLNAQEWLKLVTNVQEIRGHA